MKSFSLSFIPPWVLPLFKATAPFLLVHYLFFYEYSWLFSSVRPWFYAIVAICVLNGGQTIGGFFDQSVLAMVGLALGVGLGAIVISIFESPDLSYDETLGIALTVLFLGFAWFGYLRTFSMRYFGFALNAMLFPCIAVFTARIGGIRNLSYPATLQAAAGYLFGIFVTGCFNMMIAPDTAHNACRRFLTGWLGIIRQSVGLILKAYCNTLSPEEQKALSGLVGRLTQMLTLSGIVFNRVQSEPGFSKTTAPILVDVGSDLRSLTDIVFSIVGGLQLYQEWLAEDSVDGSLLQQLEPLAKKVQEEFDVVFENITSLLNTSTSSTSSVDIQKLVVAMCEFESRQRTILDQMHTAHFEKLRQENPSEFETIKTNQDISGLAISLAHQTENVVSFYAFNILLEELANKAVALERKLRVTCSKSISPYIPFTKWLPFWFFSLPQRLFSHDHFYENEKFSFRKVSYRLWQFLTSMDVVFAFKMSVCVLLFLILYLHPNTRSFFTTNGLSGTIINIAIIVSPTFGQSYFSAWIQIVGYMIGCFLSYATFSLCGLTTEALWVFIFVFGAAGFWVLQNRPQDSGFAILFLIAFGSTNLTNYMTLKTNSTTTLLTVFGRSLFVCGFGLAFGIAFTLLIFPRFASDELSKHAAHILNHLQQLYRGVNMSPHVPAKEILDLMAKKKDGTLNDSEYQVYLTQILEESRQRVASLQALAVKTQTELIKLYELIELAGYEPNLKGPFPKTKWLGLVSSLQTVVSRLRGAIIAMKHPWYIQESVAHIWTESAQGREKLAETIHILYYLYEGAVTLQQPLPHVLPDAVKARDMLLNQVTRFLLAGGDSNQLPRPLPQRVTEVIAKNVQRDSEHIALLVDESSDEKTLGNLWSKHRKLFQKKTALKKTESNATLQTQTETSSTQDDSNLDIFYYAYVLSIRGAIAETNNIGVKLQDLFGKPEEILKMD